MLSLEKTKSIKEVSSFIGNQMFLAMCKMDGLTCSLLYEDGRLVKAETRGDGDIGEDITHNAKTIKTIPFTLKEPVDIEVRGEIFMNKQTLEDLNRVRKERYIYSIICITISIISIFFLINSSVFLI